MGRPAVLKVDIITDARGVKPGVAEADKQLSGLGGSARKHGAAIAGGLLVAGAAAVKFGKDSVAAYQESERAALALDDAYARFPATNDVTRASFDALNASLAKKTKFDDDATASGQAVLAQYKLTGTQIQQLTPLVQDYAEKTGRDLPDAAAVLGKALQGKGKALADVGIKFKDAGSTGKNFDQIVQGLRTQVGGFAEKEAKTGAGQAVVLKNRFGEIQETVGGKLQPALLKLTSVVLGVIGVVERNHKVIVPVVAVLGALAAVVITVNTAARAYAATQAALNIVMSANPVGLVVLAIAALAAGVVIAYKRSETFRDGVNSLWSMLKKLVGYSPFGLILTHLDSIIDKVKAVGRAIANSPIGKLGGAIGGAFSSVPTFGMVAPTTAGPGALGPGLSRIATASLSYDSGTGSVGGAFSRAGVTLVDQRQIDARVFVDGALDAPGVARQLEKLLRDQAIRLGRATAYGT